MRGLFIRSMLCALLVVALPFAPAQTQTQDDVFAAEVKSFTAGTTRPSQTRYTAFRSAANIWLLSRAPVLKPASFTLAAGYGVDTFVGTIEATGSPPVGFEIVSGDPNNYFDVWPSGNLRTSEGGPVPPAGTYSLGIRGIGQNSPGPIATFTVAALASPAADPTPIPAPSAGWPDASNTGVRPGTALTVRLGGLTITQPGVYENLDIRGPVQINASDVTLKNSKVTASLFFTVNIARSATGVRIEDSTVDGMGAEGSIGINGSGTFLRNNIYNIENGFGPGSDTLIQDNYIHSLRASGAPHYDGIQVDGGQSNVTIRHNTIIVEHNQTSAVMLDNWAGPLSNMLVDNNLLVGGGYTIYVDSRFNSNPITGVSITNNHMGAGGFGTTFFTTAVTYIGNLNDGHDLVKTLTR